MRSPLPFDSYPYDPRESLVRVEFTDAAGLRWTRTMGQQPKRYVPSLEECQALAFVNGNLSNLPKWLPRWMRSWDDRRLRRDQFDDSPPF